MNHLSLFTGAGGGELAAKYFLGWRTLGYVEFNDYCQRVIAQRIKDGLLDNAPIFGDIKAFINGGYAEGYKGMVDVVSGGFPCQPFSVAGKRKAEDDERNTWPATLDTIRIVRPRIAFLENVPNLLNSGYFGRILSDLAKIGYDAKWTVLGGKVLGECSDGERLWIYAFKADSYMLEGVDIQKYKIADPKGSRRWKYIRAISKMLSQDDYARIKRGSDVLARGMERLKAIGNGQVPQVAATAWRILTGR